MNRILLVITLLLLGIHGFAEEFPVEFIKLNNMITIHRSYDVYDGYKTPSNGLLIETRKSVIIVDTAWNDDETRQIINYIKKNIQKKIAICIITHFHQDRLGGLSVISDAKIPIYMTKLTNKLQPDAFKIYSYSELKNGIISVDDIQLDIEYFGPAHSPDNIVVYILKWEILFGGCIVKSLSSNTIGSTVDADIGNWLKVILKIKDKYRDAQLVIPGHGDYGNMKLIDHTLYLLEYK